MCDRLTAGQFGREIRCCAHRLPSQTDMNPHAVLGCSHFHTYARRSCPGPLRVQLVPFHNGRGNYSKHIGQHFLRSTVLNLPNVYSILGHVVSANDFRTDRCRVKALIYFQLSCFSQPRLFSYARSDISFLVSYLCLINFV